MSRFEEHYGQSCNTHFVWSDLVKRVLIGSDMLAEMEHEMKVIKQNLKVAQDRHSNYVDHHREFKEFQVGEHVYLHIKPKRSSLRIGLCSN